MPLSPNEIKERAVAFAHEWAGEDSERAEAQSFWNGFFNVFGIDRKRVGVFEKQVKMTRAGEKLRHGRIDLFWKGTLLVEHKSGGADLDRAFAQAADYFDGLAERDLPRHILVSDFARFRLYDLEGGKETEFRLKDLYKHVRLFGFIAGYAPVKIEEQDPVNLKAALAMGRLHDALKASGYAGHALEVLLVRLLFCLFAEDTTLFEPKGAFRDYIEDTTGEDGTDLGMHLAALFDVLNTPEDKRQKHLDERLAAFPYVNGKLFEERLAVAAFDAAMRAALLDCCALDWGRISPAIFGALFQSVMDERLRRNLGAHYTSEANILKLIRPLFLDELRAEFEAARRSPKKLFELHKKIASLTFLDPACGCGNFLVIAYRELRLLELDILRAALDAGQQHLDIFSLVQVDVDRYCGIEIEEFPAQIAQVALWLTDHQMNMRVSEEFGHYYRRLPLRHAPAIACGNALALDWNEVVPAGRVDYILGNPPFVGKQHQNAEQKADMERVFAGVKGAGVLDFVAAWYMKAVDYLKDDVATERALAGVGAALPPSQRVKAAFVSTNSITQGEQVAVLWGALLARGVKIHFAHRTFQWSNDAPGEAAVHCVIVGFALHDAASKVIFDYADIQGEPHAVAAANINPYLVDAADVLLESRRQPICAVPEMGYGSKPTDGGHLLLSQEERDQLLADEPAAADWIRPFLNADEFLYNTRRYCLWLVNCPPEKLRRMPAVLKRVEAVRIMRSASTKAPTRERAGTPTVFAEIRQPETNYLLVPGHTSESRAYIPFGYMPPEVICGNANFALPHATKWHFGVISSSMHMAWVRSVCGRLESRYRYSNQIVYNNFPWPRDPTDAQQQAVEQAAQAVLDARAKFPGASLADLYDPLAMPPELRRAHQDLDRAVDAAYGRKKFAADAERVAFLFELYRQYTSLLPAAPAAKRRGRSPRRGG
ncbi:MAG: class I SAM-dependent DNA methyltransferase [Rhodocyclaceae bacterium]|nr:class I SAM-dependent DNA methyltransferase [Rhodocyclaceae bacterium]